MNRKSHIQSVFSCSLDYHKMQETADGRLCNSCNKVVIDLTDKTQAEILKLLKDRGSICGRIQKSRISYREKRSVPTEKLLTSFMILLGTTGISKVVSAQNIKFEAPQCDSLVEIDQTNLIEESVKKEEYILGAIIEKVPVYKYGGDEGLFKFLGDNLVYPKDKVEGKVYVSFTINTDGKVINPKIMRGLSPDADAEVLRVIEMLEFIPGEIGGRPTTTNYMMPIVFSLK